MSTVPAGPTGGETKGKPQDVGLRPQSWFTDKHVWSIQIKPATAPLLTNARHATAKDGSTTGSGGKNDYQMETEGGKWELERNDPKEVQEQVLLASPRKCFGLCFPLICAVLI